LDADHCHRLVLRVDPVAGAVAEHRRGERRDLAQKSQRRIRLVLADELKGALSLAHTFMGSVEVLQRLARAAF